MNIIKNDLKNFHLETLIVFLKFLGILKEKIIILIKHRIKLL